MLDAKGLEAAIDAAVKDAPDGGIELDIGAAITAYLQAVGPEPAVAVKWKQLSEIINAAVKVAIRTGSDFHIDADKLREFACSALVATPPAERVVEALREELRKVTYVPGDHPIVPIKHDAFVKAVQRIVDTSALAAKPAVKDDETVVEALRGATASLVAAVSLLKRGSKKAAPSDKMFDQMILDYEKSIKEARAALAAKDGRS